MRVLFLSYYFPPKGGAGVQRSAKFVRYLPEHGIRPIVVAGPNTSQGAWEPLDDSLLRDIGDDVPVLRPEIDLPPPSQRSRSDRWLDKPSQFDRWWHAQLVELGLRAAREHGADLIYVSMSPFSSWAAALELGKKLALPVVADLRDPWVLDEVMSWPSRWHRKASLGRMGRLVQATTRSIFNTPEAGRVAREAFPGAEQRIEVLTNGYDGADFEETRFEATDGPLPAPEAYRIVHSGTLHAAMAQRTGEPSWGRRLLGGSLSQPDHWGRTPLHLLRAMQELADSDQLLDADGRRVELHLYGGLNPADERLLDGFPELDVHRHGFVSHDETVAAVRRADLLFLPLHGLPNGVRARIVPGKTYEYLASARPILAALPEGDAAEFVRSAQAGSVSPACDSKALGNALQEHLAQGRRNDRPLDEPVLRFERRRLAERLAGILKEAQDA